MTSDGSFEARFYARQRDEILARIAAGNARRRTRRIVLPLAAALLIGALVAGGYALRPQPDPASADWLFGWDLPAQVAVADPLAPYGDESTAPADDADPDLDLLPPLFDDETIEG